MSSPSTSLLQAKSRVRQAEIQVSSATLAFCWSRFPDPGQGTGALRSEWLHGSELLVGLTCVVCCAGSAVQPSLGHAEGPWTRGKGLSLTSTFWGVTQEEEVSGKLQQGEGEPAEAD